MGVHLFAQYNIYHYLYKNLMAMSKCKICGKEFDNRETNFCSKECTLAAAF